MASGGEEIEARIESLALELATLRHRVETLESLQGTLPVAPAIPEDAVAGPQGATSVEGWQAADVVGFAGRSLVILGGGFLLRAISAAAVQDPIGPLLGLLYAAWWLWKADRTAAADQKTSSSFYALSVIAIAYPLLWETAGRFHRLPESIAAPALIVFLVCGLVVARRRSLRVLSWCFTAATALTTLALLLTTQQFILYTSILILAAAVVETFELREHWPELRWIPAGALDFALFLLAALVSQPRMSPEMAASLPWHGVVAVSLLAPLVYLTSVTAATLSYRRPIVTFELLQVMISLLLGIATAFTAIDIAEGDPTAIAIGMAVIGTVCYGIAFRSIDVAEHPRINFIAYTTFAGVLVFAGTWLALGPAIVAAVWLSLAVSGIALGIRYERNTLRLHGALYLAIAGMASGLATVGLGGLFGPLEQLRPTLNLTAAVVAVASVACYLALAARRSRIQPHWSEHVPRFILAAVASWSIAGLCAPWVASLLPVIDGSDPIASLASVRTCVLSLLAVALAWAGRRWSLSDFVWLVYPVLAATGARLLLEDLRYGGPLNLFLALGFYGGALIVTSQLLRQEPHRAVTQS